MLLQFSIKNYRSFRDEATLYMEATSKKEHVGSLIEFQNKKYIPAVAIFGRNGSGKSNIIRAFWLGVQFITNAQRTQDKNTPVPVVPFKLDDQSFRNPVCFRFVYVWKNIRYEYGFSATRERIVNEYLYSFPKNKKTIVFNRTDGNNFDFPKNNEWKRKKSISSAVSENQLFFAIACVLNYSPCLEAMHWFSNLVEFSRDYSDISLFLIQNRTDQDKIQAMIDAAKIADFGIENIQLEFENQKIEPNKLQDFDQKGRILKALLELKEALGAEDNTAEIELDSGTIKSTTYHRGLNAKGESELFSLKLSEESDGTRKFMLLFSDVEQTLQKGGVFLVDELEDNLHPFLMEYIIKMFQNPEKNMQNAQIIFTTHNTEILEQGLLRRDQVYFVEKDRETGASELYSLSDFETRNDTDVHKAYILGKFGAVPIL